MVIPEEQLNRWSQQGAQATAINTHESIRAALAAPSSSLKGIDYEIFLQGSYKNDTNIKGDSDVDVVVKLKTTFRSNIDELSEEEQRLHRNAYPQAATYTWSHFHRDVLASLRNYYGSTIITDGNKSIKVAARQNTIDADVLVSCLYRKYTRFRSPTDTPGIEGIYFWTQRENNCIISYPKPHYENLVEKNRSTNMQFKPAVRMLKNARSYLIDKGTINDKLAPSYLLECLIYNVPDDRFSSNAQRNYYNIVDWLNTNEIKDVYCPNKQVKLFGYDLGQWSVDSAKSFIHNLVQLWNDW